MRWSFWFLRYGAPVSEKCRVAAKRAVLGHAANGQQLQLDAARRVFVDGQPVGVGRHGYRVGRVDGVSHCGGVHV